jgi:hypothetical protein
MRSLLALCVAFSVGCSSRAADSAAALEDAGLHDDTGDAPDAADDADDPNPTFTAAELAILRTLSPPTLPPPR